MPAVSNVKLPMFLMPVLTNVFTSNIAARGTAAQVEMPGPGAGDYSPFSPFAHPKLVPAPPNPAPVGDPGDPFNLKSAKLIGAGYYLNSSGAVHDNIIRSLAQRVLQDSDSTSTTYADYASSGVGNGEHVLLVPLNVGPCGPAAPLAPTHSGSCWWNKAMNETVSRQFGRRDGGVCVHLPVAGSAVTRRGILRLRLSYV
jgi:hypothetical protein